MSKIEDLRKEYENIEKDFNSKKEEMKKFFKKPELTKKLDLNKENSPYIIYQPKIIDFDSGNSSFEHLILSQNKTRIKLSILEAKELLSFLREFLE
ncbi:MAG: hypothetical protein LBD41_07845 [Clostridiales Family XIII bacterium]|jgi:hypothetical protein|nr:hypothetical protein [Clostridiales Family XIII bacterium]